MSKHSTNAPAVRYEYNRVVFVCDKCGHRKMQCRTTKCWRCAVGMMQATCDAIVERKVKCDQD